MAITIENKNLYIRLFKLLKPYIKKISIIFVCIVVSAGINMLLPLLSKQIMDKNLNVVVKYSVLTFLIVMFEQVIGLLQTKYYAYVNTVFQYSLTKMAFKHIQKLKLQYFNNTNFSEIMSNIGINVVNIW